MTYRAPTHRCTYCDNAPIGDCLRCGSALCLGHWHVSDRRCDECEDDYVARFRQLRLRLWSLVGPALCAAPVVLLWQQFWGHESYANFWDLLSGAGGVLLLALFATAAAVYSAFAVPAQRTHFARLRFLAQRSGTRIAPVAPPIAVDAESAAAEEEAAIAEAVKAP